jgi:hypothetical protein
MGTGHGPARPKGIHKQKFSGDSSPDTGAAEGIAPVEPFGQGVLAVRIRSARITTGGRMSMSAEMRCRCGQVRGIVSNALPRAGNRAVCYCDDCQAFLHRLGRADLLNAQGGTDIVQVAPATLTFVQGQHLIRGLRLTPKGLFRWYASCCNTPVGNTLSPSVPFVGIVTSAFDHGMQQPDDLFGEPVGGVFGKYAVGEKPVDAAAVVSLPLMLRTLGKIFSWRLRGKAWPHPFFKRDGGAPTYPVKVLSKEEREALRPLCGPHPTAAPSAT